MKFVLYGLALVGVVAAVYFSVLFSVFPLKYKAEIESASKLYGVDSALIASVINAESGYKANAVSSKGAVGLMQVMPATAEWVAKKMKIELYDLKDPKTNILIGTYYLKYLLDKFGDTKTALMAYNAGEGKVQGWLNEKKACPYPETNKYVEKVLNGRKFYSIRL